MTDWNGAMAAMDAAVADCFDVDAIRAIGRKDGVSVNAPRSDDAARTPFDFSGSLELGPRPSERRSAGDPGAPREGVQHEGVVTALMQAWPWQPRRKDHLEIAGARWSIDDIVEDGTGRKVYLVNRV